MSKSAWEVDMLVRDDYRGELNRKDFHTYIYRFEADSTTEAKEKILVWAREKLNRFVKWGGRSVEISAAPSLENGAGDATRMLRNRFKFTTIKSLMAEVAKAEDIFVVGYGPESWAELSK